jgi:hypothetical protein
LLAIALKVTGWMARPRIRRRLEILTGGGLVASASDSRSNPELQELA